MQQDSVKSKPRRRNYLKKRDMQQTGVNINTLYKYELFE